LNFSFPWAHAFNNWQYFDIRLMPDPYEAFNPMAYEQARDTNVEIGIDLREAGFGVWQA